MHNCQKTKEEILDLLFREASEAQTVRLKNELQFCAECQFEYAEMQNTFAGYEKFSAIDAPAESYWQNYEANLTRKLLSIETSKPKESFVARFYSGLFAAQIRIPIPVAAGFVLLFASAAFFAGRLQIPNHQPAEIVTESQIQFVPVETEKIVTREKEVWRNRFVTQKVYLPQRENKARNSVQTESSTRQKSELAASEKKIPLLNLAEFQPAQKVEPKVVASGAYDDK